ncbi:Origin recognition complex subunit 5 [Massospora cicadina]|nr:Origin recognition complex subunit 5 [Massospora cicadina]
MAERREELLAIRREVNRKLNELAVKYPGRSQQISKLNNLVGRGMLETLHGASNVYAFINCAEAFTPRIIFERILNTFNGSYPTFPPAPNAKSYIRCSQLPIFIELLGSVIAKRRDVFTWFLVFDQVERMRDAAWNFLPVLFKLSEKTGGNFSVILIGKVPWENLRPSLGVREPVIVHFPEYTRQELVEILARTSPHTLPPYSGTVKRNGKVFREFAAILYDTAYRFCRNLTEMQHLATQIYPHYVKPLLDEPNLEHSTPALFAKSKPHFENATRSLYTRGSASNGLQPKEQASSLLHLPHYAKFLLVASYLASYNPAKSDLEYFYRGPIPGQGNKRQRVNASKQAAKTSKVKANFKRIPHWALQIAPQLMGPRPFTLERMLAIFYSIVDDPHLTTTIHIDTQIATLSSLQLLTPMGAKLGQSGKLAQLKYKAALPLDATKQIAQQLDFPLDRYLYSDDN